MNRLVSLLFLAYTGAQLTLSPRCVNNHAASQLASTQIDISGHFNNRGFGLRPADANFDGSGNAYPAQYLPPSQFVCNGINFSFPQYQSNGGNDNLVANGTTFEVTKGRYAEVAILAATESAQVTGELTVTYKDSSTSSGAILVNPFLNGLYPLGGDLIFPFYHGTGSNIYNRPMIYFLSSWVDPTKEVVSIQLPEGQQNVHVFSVSLVQAPSSGTTLAVQFARSTQLWMEGTDKVQIIEATISNVGEHWVLAHNAVTVNVEASGMKTVYPGIINRLRPGDQTIVHIGVENQPNVKTGSIDKVSVKISGRGIKSSPYSFRATHGIVPYKATYQSIYSHESPQWYNDAKFGIFIHWGVYSVPGWGNKGNREAYAEWYWSNMNEGPNSGSQTYQYHLHKYGENFTYDNFIPEFTASNFNPQEWVDLIAAAGAQYMVPVTKHHDGYALFDMPATVSKRNSVAQTPHRNLIKELFDAAKKYQPQIRRGTYFSLPEWYNPAYAPYGFGSWPGGNASNPYTNQTLPYTGFVPVSDFLSDIMLPQMEILASMGTEIMWCDIGGANLTTKFASAWFNSVAKHGRQVVMDNRCGLPGDFDTPEYARYDSVQTRKWESNLGMDPFSYGFNRATPKNQYLNAEGIVQSLVDITSKNGNFLLDIGPKADGTILEVEKRNLQEAGKWITSHAEAIFNTTYWFITPEEGDLRFTQNQNNFYIMSLSQPQDMITINSPVPWVKGDKVTVVGGQMAGTVAPSKLLANGSLEIQVSPQVAQADDYTWVFKINYGGKD